MLTILKLCHKVWVILYSEMVMRVFPDLGAPITATIARVLRTTWGPIGIVRIYRAVFGLSRGRKGLGWLTSHGRRRDIGVFWLWTTI